MPIAIAEHHEMLRQSARRWLESYCPREVPRAVLDDERRDPAAVLEGTRATRDGSGFTSHEEHGGQGGGLLELAVVVEEMARAMAPGPFLTDRPRLGARRAFAATRRAPRQLLPGLVDGTTPASVVLPGAGELEIGRTAKTARSSYRVGCPPVLVGGHRGRLVVRRPESPAVPATWVVLVDRRTGSHGGAAKEPRPDATRRFGAGGPCSRARRARPRRRDDAMVRRLMLVLVAAECSGGARWCLETATQHAKDRRQFGRPIGQFQAVKHRLADMLVSVEQVTALGLGRGACAGG